MDTVKKYIENLEKVEKWLKPIEAKEVTDYVEAYVYADGYLYPPVDARIGWIIARSIRYGIQGLFQDNLEGKKLMSVFYHDGNDLHYASEVEMTEDEAMNKFTSIVWNSNSLLFCFSSV